MPRFGEERLDVFMLAAEPVKRGHMLRRMVRPRWGVKRARGRNTFFCPIALWDAKKGEGLWVRVYGDAPVRVA